MTAAPLNILAVALYLGATAACIAAWRIAARRRRPGAERVRWAAVALFFTFVAALRFFGVEEGARTQLRRRLLENREYFDRWEFQAPAAATAVLVIAVSMAAMLFLHPARRPPPKQRSRLLNAQWIADLAVAAMCGLIVLRLISLHSVDFLLYHGLHLNWLIDVGSTAAALFAALRYCKLLTSPKG